MSQNKKSWVSFITVLIFIAFISFSYAANSDQLIEMKESKYNNIYIYKKGSYVSMNFGHNLRFYTESVYNEQNERELPVIYTRYMTVSLAYTKPINSIVQIGLGGGRTSWYVHKHLPETLVTAVEIDPDVIALAKKYFGIKEENNFKIEASDGRLFLVKSKGGYDIIFIDAYRGPFVPFHLLTKEFYNLVKSKLKSGGVLIQNIEPSTMLFDSAIATIKSIFNNIELYNANGNMVCIAYDGSLRTVEQLNQNAAYLQRQYHLYYDLTRMISERRLLTEVPKVKPLTDDFAPVEYLNAIKKHNLKRN